MHNYSNNLLFKKNKLALCFVAGTALAFAGFAGSAFAALTATPDYRVILGHDGHPDPDDNLATMAGAAAAVRNAETNPRIKLHGMIYGDTTQSRKNGMINGGGTDNEKGKANYTFFKNYSKNGVASIGISPIFDTVVERSDFTGNSFTAMTAGGEHIATAIKNAIDLNLNERVVYTAGGGINAAAEAVAYLRKQGYTDTQIRDRFAVVQHSGWNIKNATETTAQNIIVSFTIRIKDQNDYTGVGKLTFFAEASRTSVAFESAWRAARLGTSFTQIPNLKGTSDGSDAGSHDFATSSDMLDANWGKRASSSWWMQVDPSQEVKYSRYTPAVTKADVCDGACPTN